MDRKNKTFYGEKFFACLPIGCEIPKNLATEKLIVPNKIKKKVTNNSGHIT